MDQPTPPPGRPGAVTRIREWSTATAERATSTFEELRERVGAVDLAARIYERDKDAGGTLIGSALAVRLFLFFAPLVLFLVGLAGVVGRQADVSSPADAYGITGSMADYIDQALDQQGSAPWFAMSVGLVGIATTGRTLSRALTLSSALSWQLGGKQKLAVRAIGIVIGLVVGLALTAAIVNRIRESSGLAVASISLVAVLVVYLVLWSLLYLALPRGTSDPSAALPGAVLVALVLTGLQAFTQFFLPDQISSSSALYGSLGVLLTILGWFFVIGRVIALSFAVNAVVYERVGSLSTFVFDLPGLRAIPRRFPAVARFFELDHEAGGD
jgi:uncharacterized BrkB/YihY/UPF0761 family membrane protein